MEQDQQRFEGWFIIEQMGHKRLAGFIQEQQIAGCGFLRIDVPGDAEAMPVSQFIHPSTVYCLTPCTEEVVRALVKKMNYTPPGLLELPSPRHSSEEFEPDEDFE